MKLKIEGLYVQLRCNECGMLLQEQGPILYHPDYYMPLQCPNKGKDFKNPLYMEVEEAPRIKEPNENK